MASQISPVWYIDFWDLCLRLGVAVVLGGLIGIERELSNHPAGFRTHILVCIGSALIMLLSIYGFLGAGTIIRKGVSISGLTTAASLWATAGIGLSAGAGFYSGALLTTFLVLICLFVLNKLEKSKMMRNKEEIVFLVDDTPDVLGRIMLQLGQSDIKIKQIRVSSNDSEDGSKTIRCSVRETDEKVLEQCVSQMESVPGVREVEFTMHSKKIVFETSGDTSFKEVSRLP